MQYDVSRLMRSYILRIYIASSPVSILFFVSGLKPYFKAPNIISVTNEPNYVSKQKIHENVLYIYIKMF